VEILIFSCRTTGWFFLDLPSFWLVMGVMFANVAVSLCAVYGVIVEPRLDWEWVGNIWAYDIMWLFVIDAFKVFLNRSLGNEGGETLELASEEEAITTVGSVSGREGAPQPSSSSLHQRNSHRSSTNSVTSMRRSTAQRLSVRASLSSRRSDFGGAAAVNNTPRSSSLRPSLPSNLARDNAACIKPAWGAYVTATEAVEDLASASSDYANEPLLSKLG